MQGEFEPWLVVTFLAVVCLTAMVFLRGLALQVRNRVEVLDVAREAARLRIHYEDARQRRLVKAGGQAVPPAGGPADFQYVD